MTFRFGKANGDSYNRVRPAVALEILRQMGWITEKELEALSVDFGPDQAGYQLAQTGGRSFPSRLYFAKDCLTPMDPLQKLARQVHQRLLDFYGQPVWRNPLPPVDELISTILSQNTNDINRDRAFESLRRKFPTWEGVRDADPASVIAAIRLAGLSNQKGPRIQQVLQDISAERGSLDLNFLKDLPLEEARAWLKKFKGVGPKTAAIVLLFSLGRPAFPVDTHIFRVTGRIGLLPGKMTVEQAHPHLEKLFPSDTYYSAHLNIIRLGREICCPPAPGVSHLPSAYTLQICKLAWKFIGI